MYLFPGASFCLRLRGQYFQLRLIATQDLTLFSLLVFYSYSFALFYCYLIILSDPYPLSLLDVSLFATTGFFELYRALFRLASKSTMIL